MRAIAIRYGLLLCASLIAFFLLMHFFGLSQNYNLRILNSLLHVSFLYLAISRYAQRYPDSIDNYLSGVGVGMWAGGVGVAAFAFFMTVFLLVQPDFMKMLQTQTPMGQYLTPFTAGAAILMEGLSVNIVASYIIVRIVQSSKVRQSR